MQSRNLEVNEAEWKACQACPAHSAFRCASCLALEDLTREVILGTAAAPGPLAAEVKAGRIALPVVDLDTQENGALARRLGVGPKTVLIAEEMDDGTLRTSTPTTTSPGMNSAWGPPGTWGGT